MVLPGDRCLPRSWLLWVLQLLRVGVSGARAGCAQHRVLGWQHRRPHLREGRCRRMRVDDSRLPAGTHPALACVLLPQELVLRALQAHEHARQGQPHGDEYGHHGTDVYRVP